MLNLNFIPFPILTTDRFALRPLRSGDDKEIFLLRTDKGINEFIDRQPPSSLEETRAFISSIHEGIQKGAAILWAIAFKGEETLAGTICLWKISVQDSKAEIGYELLPQHHGKGIIQEVMPVVIRFGFEEIGLAAIEAELHRMNVKSLKLLERNGFVRDEEFENESSEELVLYRLERNQ